MSETPGAWPVTIDIVSDVVCPWCIIGYKQLEIALSVMPGEFEADVNWHPFELNPQMPPEGQNLRQHLAEKYGTNAEQSSGARNRLTQLGEALGFTFNFDDELRMVNTFQAHQLLHWAHEQGRQTDLKLLLFAAYFSEGRDVSQPAELVQLAVTAGLPEEGAREVLESGRYAEPVRSAQRLWREREVHAVPAFVFNSQYMVPGAQEAETFLRILKNMRAKAD